MRKRSEEILQTIIKNNKTNTSVDSFEKSYRVTQRTIRNDIAEINEFLKKFCMSEIYVDTDGVLHTNSDFDTNLLETELMEMDTYIYKLCANERQVYITLLLLWNRNFIIMKHLADTLYVSRVTILNDFDAIKKCFENKDAKVISVTGKGVSIVCTDMQRINLLMDIFRKLTLNIDNEGFFQRFVLEQLNIRYTFNDVCAYAQEYLSINNLVFVDDILYNIVLYLFIIFNLLKEQHPYIHIDDVNEIDNLMIYVGYRIGCKCSDKMLLEFREYIKNNGIRLYMKSLDEIEFYEIITHFLSNIDQEMNLALSQDKVLIDSLLQHIKNMRDWGELEFEFSEINESVLDFHLLLSTVDKNLYVLENYLSYCVNENMKRSIMIHICVAMIRNYKKTQKPSVIIACPGSMATGRYLEAQVSNYFDFTILGLYPAAQLSRRLEHAVDVDFIISTVEVKHIDIKCLKVHAVLTMKDMNIIQRASFEFQKNRAMVFQPKTSKETSIPLLKQLQHDYYPASLYKKIENLIFEYNNENHEYINTAIGEFLLKGNIIFDDSSVDWEQCIRKSAAVLIQKGCVGEGFVEKAIQNIKDYGDYIILGDGVALAHAGKEFEVYKDSLSLLVSHRGITFTDSDKKVNFLFCFSSRGSKDHIGLFQEIVEIGQDNELRNKLLQMSENELFETLCIRY